MRVLICGDRNWGSEDSYEQYMIRNQIVSLMIDHVDDLVIIHGGAPGADSWAQWYCQNLGVETVEYKAAWKCLDSDCKKTDEDGNVYHRDIHGKAAGPIRNKKMLEDGHPDLVIAYHDDIEKSLGTRNMIALAENAGVPVILWTKKAWQDYRLALNGDFR